MLQLQIYYTMLKAISLPNNITKYFSSLVLVLPIVTGSHTVLVITGV
jgi:hypothetical protein